MTAGRYDAATLHGWGVVDRVLPDDGFDTAARAFAATLAAGATRAHAATKQVLAALRAGGVTGADARVPAVAGELFGTEDLPAALASFRADGPGKATFRGR